MRTLDSYIDATEHLVPAPVVLSQILPLLNRPDVDSNRIVELVAQDQALTANVLRVCNSAYYACGLPIDHLQLAIARIGFRQLYDIIVSVLFWATLGRPLQGYSIESNELWEHSMAVAIATRLIAADFGLDPQVAFTAGVLHDIGKIVLSPALEKNRDQIAYEMDQNSLPPFEIERKLLGVDHAETGGRLLQRWQLPVNLMTAVRYHHQPALATEHGQLAAAVNLGNFITYFMGRGYGKYSVDLKARRETRALIEVSPKQMSRYMNHSAKELEQIQHLYGVASSPPAETVAKQKTMARRQS